MKTKDKKILVIGAIAILLAIILIVVIILLKCKNNEEKNDNEEIISAEYLEQNFSSIFTNNSDDEIVYLAYKIDEESNGKYEINANVPQINLESENIVQINNDINQLFSNKIISVIDESTEYTTYNVDYRAYINNNILSLVIKATLKEGSNPKREIVQTYNYDIENDKILDLSELMNKKNLQSEDIQNKILERINVESSKVEEAKNQGYNVYVRNIDSAMYKIENITTYFLGQDGYLYIIFAYGNNNFTTEMDVLVF